MELQFQKPQNDAAQQQQQPRARSKCGGGNKFVGVRQRPSGRWVAEIKDTTQKIRMWLGTFETAEEAARAYDEAACLLRGANTRTNFATAASAAAAPAASSPVVPADSQLASRIRALLNHKKLKKNVVAGFYPAAAAYRRHGRGSVATSTIANASTITTTSSSSGSAGSTINFAMTSGGGVRTPILPAAHTEEAAACYRPSPYLFISSGGGGDEFQLASQQQQQQYEQLPWVAALNSTTTTRLLPPPTDDEGRRDDDSTCPSMSAAAEELEKKTTNDDPEEQEPPQPRGGTIMDDSRFHRQDQDFFETAGGNNDPSDSSLWDLPPICPLSCRSLMY